MLTLPFIESLHASYILFSLKLKNRHLTIICSFYFDITCGQQNLFHLGQRLKCFNQQRVPSISKYSATVLSLALILLPREPHPPSGRRKLLTIYCSSLLFQQCCLQLMNKIPTHLIHCVERKLFRFCAFGNRVST